MGTRYGPKERAGGVSGRWKVSHDGLSSEPQPPAVGTRNSPDQLTVGLACETAPEGGVAAMSRTAGTARARAARTKRDSRGIGVLLSTPDVRSTKDATPMRKTPQNEGDCDLIFSKPSRRGRLPCERPPNKTGPQARKPGGPSPRCHGEEESFRRVAGPPISQKSR